MFSQMRNNYAQSWDRYNRSLGELQNNLAPQGQAAQQQAAQQQAAQQQAAQEQAAQQQSELQQAAGQLAPQQQEALMRQLRGNFNNEQLTGASEMFTDPQMRQRYNQMYLQYLGPDAFDLPTVQEQLGLSRQQITRLQRIQRQWYAQMQRLSQNFENDPDGAETFNQLRSRAGKAIMNILDEDQARIWQDMIGTPFDLPVRAYFPSQRQGLPEPNSTDNTFNGVPGAAGNGNPGAAPQPTQPGEQQQGTGQVNPPPLPQPSPQP
jgi:uncharacterized protein with von Willebrand factor type A (vWA) domain